MEEPQFSSQNHAVLFLNSDNTVGISLFTNQATSTNIFVPFPKWDGVKMRQLDYKLIIIIVLNQRTLINKQRV
ncbi:unnamed protein product [Allacma fusca]|uniref:Uncharacterized protein n=1 Tax=Allacma fusca TaxID=39272 RepID=A0A8J2P8X8_9HEXA|nr:unnamed protein product [Allacma fusca]